MNADTITTVEQFKGQLFILHGLRYPLTQLYSHLMDTKILIAGIVISCFFGCDKCEGDEFGAYMKLILPINTTPSQDTFIVGDTLWIEANIDKYVEVKNQSNRIYLEGFNFFTEFFISEISDTIENFTPAIEFVEDIGNIDQLPLPTATTYPLFFVEEDTSYMIKIGLVFMEEGRYNLGFITDPILFENYDHSAVYLCEDTKRYSIEIQYSNVSTNRSAFDNIFLATNVEYLKELVDYTGHQLGGGHTFIVKE